MLLMVSLALNLLVAGVVIGDIVSDHGRGRGPRPVELALGPFARAMDAADRRAILQSLRGNPDLQPLSKAQRAAAFGEILATLRAEPFDRIRAEAALSAQAERIQGLERMIQGALLDRLAAMTAEQRAALADRLQAELGHGPGPD
ncbi:hypothetical protein Rumeso_02973 [Rubellimicrobium mesophilum DSM 19309]|uniref:Periplasmic heavy metal sensor n=2 Tax=Rubellimicrobium TaxID=295418 RepID=A0A017HMF4_9RHOB|nr:hypothetical protein Rumeso_02973 [Rubellimicrobium mesophilum DSM 19309]